jgi:lipopolysaccharide/colanic/teichoic acid biosynthesis glycosyltransferase
MSQRSRTGLFHVGYLQVSEALNRFFSIVFSLALLVFAAPLMLLIALVILAVDGLPVFYSGVRLGKDKRLFRMYKFRTLVPAAQGLIGGEVFTTQLSSNRDLLTRTGSFLRDTRLDELPQFLNVLRGDMDILGPRPERPEVYEKLCRNIRGYDRRFTVKPGLIGYSQIFTPHSTPKRIRHLVDNKFLTLRHRYSLEVFVVSAALLMLTVRLFRALFAVVRRNAANLFRGRSEKRALPRLEPKNTLVRFGPAGDAPGAALPGEAVLKDINEEALLLYSATPVGDGPLSLRITAPIVNWHGHEVLKTAYCTGRKLYQSSGGPGPYPNRCVIRYTPDTPRNGYIVHQYLLGGSIAHVGRGNRQLRPAPA